MSKSKRAARAEPTPAPRPKSNLFTRPDGGLRTGWLLAVSLIAYALLALAVRRGLARGCDALLGLWGVDADSAWRAPGWARLFYAWHGSLVTAIFAGLSLGLSRLLGKLWPPSGARAALDGRGLLRWTSAGALAALAILLLGLLPDSVRPEWPLGAPRLSPGLIWLCGVSLLSVWGEEAFSKRVLYDGVRARWGRPWATAIACGAFFLMNGGYAGNAICAVNVALMGLLCALVYARRGLWAAVGLRWGWSAVTTLALGFGGGDSAVYRFYGVSENLLTGGDAGPVYGLWMTLLLAAGIVRLGIPRLGVQKRQTE